MINGTATPMEMLFSYVKDGGFVKFEVTPGGGFKAGVGLDILAYKGGDLYMRSYGFA